MINHVNPILLKGIRVYSEKEMIKNGFIKIKDQKIIEIGSIDELIDEDEFEVIELPAYYKAIPGFIDVHIHGVNGADTMDATKEALDTMVTALPKEGTTSFLATTMTQEGKQIENALKNAAQYIEKQPSQGKAEILGLHLEGPFVNAKRAGAQPIQHIVDPDLALFKEWQTMTNGNIKLVTLAPERPGGLEMIRYLKENGIIASIGHSDATYEEVGEAIEAGANHVTHLFNQMRGLHHREPGIVGAAFLRDELIAEIIVDGVHVRPEMVELAYKQKQSDGLILITDSMRAKCMKNGKYDLGGQEVTVQDGKAVLADGTLAGSILRLGQAVKNIVNYTGCSLENAIEMASVNPAKQLNVFERKGSLAEGKDGDIVILDKNLEVFMTFCRGELAFKKEED
ncbi:N-acetylglucosamine-6-phosphate deacetylase [Neobacillus rhizosphaerae]|uniref:N-acetylglucosamine-6-phosphate deacetylase n=1 Tax=Neobacillus rhizosphaerae TaxID=2880965 RepID=A0ABN8KJN4_9BACI|nr:N-acetylglucosamine-6-phosphate deacetylase [Neobacillus rhizosphaerae]CAH2713666.1 N-acetylglucosamine-6-phosphate deacetylase [Neobacillus rhizosphaerae]